MKESDWSGWLCVYPCSKSSACKWFVKKLSKILQRQILHQSHVSKHNWFYNDIVHIVQIQHNVMHFNFRSNDVRQIEVHCMQPKKRAGGAENTCTSTVQYVVMSWHERHSRRQSRLDVHETPLCIKWCYWTSVLQSEVSLFKLLLKENIFSNVS